MVQNSDNQNILETEHPDLVKLLVNKEDAVLTCGSPKKVRWWCENGERHWFDMEVCRKVKGVGCPVCAGRRVFPGFNDLTTVRPEVAGLFNVEQTRIQSGQCLEKRWAMSPQEVTAGSDCWAVWDCDNGEGHWYETTIEVKTRGQKCPYCYNRRVLSGFNDLASQCPDIAKYFNVEETRRHAEKHPEKNWAVSPEEVTAGSSLWVVWDCENGKKHWYDMTVTSRVRYGCPYCSGSRVLPGFNDLASQRPDIARYFNVEQTRIYAEKYPGKKWATTPGKVTVSSNRRAVWNCENGEEHYFDATVNNRARGYGCSYCCNRQVLPGFNDLTTVRPDIAQRFNREQTRIHAEKHPEKNWAVSPEEVTAGSNLYATWNCEEGHWYIAPVKKLLSGRGCAVCAGHQVFPGFNDVTSLFPDISRFFNTKQTKIQAEKYPEKNWVDSLEDTVKKSNKRAVWNCENGEEHWYEMVVSDRTSGRGCGFCIGQRVLPGFNDLAFLRPDVAELWDDNLNAKKI